jgi:hypothetical protein
MTTDTNLVILPGPTLREGLDNLGQPLASVTPIRDRQYAGLHFPGAHQHFHRDNDVSRATCICTEDVWAEDFTAVCPKHEARAYVALGARHLRVIA